MSTGKYDTSKSVADFITERPTRSELFEELGLDYCCGGDQPLEKAARAQGLELSEVTDRLRQFDEEQVGDLDEINWKERPMGELIDHIVEHHHGYLREQLPRLEKLAATVQEVHGENHPELAEVRDEFGELKQELREHMMKEEGVFFPICRDLEAGELSPDKLSEGLDEPVDQLEHEHDEASESLHRMRELTDEFTPPDDACGKYRALLAGLRELEKDLHLHIHEENNILFPRAAQRAEELRRSG